MSVWKGEKGRGDAEGEKGDAKKVQVERRETASGIVIGMDIK
jgi:hypothetical protein